KCALYNGGAACGGCFNRALREGLGLSGKTNDTWACKSVPDVMTRRAVINGCGTETGIAYEDGPVHCKSWRGCPARGGVTLCTIEGGGHHWQGSKAESCGRPDGRMCKIRN